MSKDTPVCKNNKSKTKRKNKVSEKEKTKQTKNNEAIIDGSDTKAQPSSEETSNPNIQTMGIKEFEQEVKRYIVGQDEAVRKIVTAVFRSIIMPDIKSNVLIIGKSGTGKTAIVKQIAQMLILPCTIEDATKYTQEGYYGADVEEMVMNLIQEAVYDLQKAANGIIVVDEIDKKAGTGIQNDVAGVEVLRSLLKIMEGTTIRFPLSDDTDFVNFSTDNIFMIFMGAFPGLDKIRDSRLNRNSLGFADAKEPKKGEEKYLKQDLVKYGLPEEFVGRIDLIVEMNDLGAQELAQILKESRLSVFSKYAKELKSYGVLLEYDESIFDSIAQKSLSLDTGARELRSTVNYIFENIIYDIFTHPGEYTKCVLLPGIVEDNTQYRMI